MKIWLIAAALLVPAAAHADQCQLLDADVAARVRSIVMEPHRYAELCEPCGEKVPGVPFSARTTEVGDELVLDGKPHDLAYLYVQTAPSRFENLAMLAGCPVEGVSPSLAVEAETPDGVLITADGSPVTMRLPREVAALPPPVPPSPAPTYYSTTIVYSVPWIAVAALAGSGGFVLGLITALVLLGARRRRAMTPRAADLTA